MKLLVKNFWIGLICLILLFGLAGSAEASVVKFTIDSPQYSVDKAEYQMDAAPYIKDGRTYIPIRYVASVCGVKMDNIRYDGQTGTAALIKDDGTEITLKLGSRQIFINGVSSTTDAAPELVRGRIYVPVRHVVLVFQRKVYWDEKNRSILVDIGDYLSKAVEDLQKESYSSALEICNEFLDISPNDSGARLVKGIAQFKLKDMEGAMDSFDKAVELDPLNDLAYLSRAEARWGIYMKDKEAKALTDSESKESLDKILADVSKSIEVSKEPMLLYCRRAGLYNYLGEYAKAIADCDKAIELNPDFQLAYYRKATAIYLKNGQDSFENELDKITIKFPDDQWAASCQDILKNNKKFVFDLTDW